MKFITRNGWFAPNGVMYRRQDPWTRPQSAPDDLFAALPSMDGTFVVVPPKGYRFDPAAKPDARGMYTKKAVIKDERPAVEADGDDDDDDDDDDDNPDDDNPDDDKPAGEPEAEKEPEPKVPDEGEKVEPEPEDEMAKVRRAAAEAAQKRQQGKKRR